MAIPIGNKKRRGEKQAIRAQLLTNEIVCDIVGGMGKADVLEKLRLGVYNHSDRPLATAQTYRWWNRALERMRIDSEDEIEDKRQILWSRYENLYMGAVEQGNVIAAKGILDSMAKVFGLSEPEKKEVTFKNISVDFGFDDGGED